MYREPLGGVLEWPLSHINAISNYLGQRPAPEERLEYAIAQLNMTLSNVHRERGTSPKQISDFLLFKTMSAADKAIASGRYNEEELKSIKALRS